jgi:hypothetical protein
LHFSNKVKLRFIKIEIKLIADQNRFVVMRIEEMLELIKNTFETDAIQQVTRKTSILGLFTKKETRFYVPSENLKKVAEDFPFIKNAVKAGLIEKDESNKYYITADVLTVRKTDERKGKKQFFSLNGEDEHERTTVYDALHTIINVRDFAKSFKVEPNALKYTIEHAEGNADKILNYVQVDASHFGDNEDEIIKNVELINQNVKFKRN